jgi:methylase of polypeptide subunit release factors
VLVAGGAVAFEVADGKAAGIAAALDESGYREVTVTHDLAGRERIVDGRTRR